MPARIAFDYDRALDRATRLFWKKGYSRASLRQLLQTMGIGEGSFYNTFGSKKRLYSECLKRYGETVTRRRIAALMEPASVKAGIRAFFRTVLDELEDPRTPQVCMLSGSLSSDVLAERELNRQVMQDMAKFSDFFLQRLQAAKRQGELPEHFEVEVTAQVILTYLQGLFRVVRVLQTREQLERQIEILLTGLGL